MVLRDIAQAWDDYVGNTITVTVISSGVPWGQTEFNPGEKVKYTLEVINGTTSTGVQVRDIRLHLRAGRVADSSLGIFNFIVPPTSKATAYPDAISTTALKPDTEHPAMFLQNANLATLTPGELVTISDLEVIGKVAGTAELQAHVHATLDLGTLFPGNHPGKDGTKILTVET